MDLHANYATDVWCFLFSARASQSHLLHQRWLLHWSHLSGLLASACPHVAKIWIREYHLSAELTLKKNEISSSSLFAGVISTKTRGTTIAFSREGEVTQSISINRHSTLPGAIKTSEYTAIFLFWLFAWRYQWTVQHSATHNVTASRTSILITLAPLKVPLFVRLGSFYLLTVTISTNSNKQFLPAVPDSTWWSV